MDGTSRCGWRLVTPPPTGQAAIAVIELTGDVDVVLARMGIRPVAPGAVALRSLAGVDEGVIARFYAASAFLMPHAGPAVVRRLMEALRDAGVPEAKGADPMDAWPEASSPIEARMLDALSRAASPLAMDLLLDQPRRWAEPGAGSRVDPERSRQLNRLIDPPLVVALGRPNIGKSSLLNALAGRSVAIVADQPGTTRDHVGVMLDVGGLVVRYIDTPGIGAGGGTAIDAAAQDVALRVAQGADLVLLCADPFTECVDLPAGEAARLRVGLRSDLASDRPAGTDVAVSVRRGEGLELLAARMREALVPTPALHASEPWKFW